MPIEAGNESFQCIFDGETVVKDGKVNLAGDRSGFGFTLQHPDPTKLDLTN